MCDPVRNISELQNWHIRPISMQGKVKFVLFVLALGAGLVTILLVNSPCEVSPALPSPNGYDDLIKAAELVVPEFYSLQTNLADLTTLREVVASNSPALALARAGLLKECGVPVENSDRYPERHLPELSRIKRLALEFRTEGQLAEAESAPGRAAGSYLECVRLGLKGLKGGLMITRLVSISCCEIGLRPLANLTAQLNAQECRDAAADLEQMLAQAEPWNDTLVAEKQWSRRSFGWTIRLASVLYRAYTKNNYYQKGEQKVTGHLERVTDLMVELAARAYELEKKEKPSKIEDLEPEYLKAVPIDPATGKHWSKPIFNPVR